MRHRVATSTPRVMNTLQAPRSSPGGNSLSQAPCPARGTWKRTSWGDPLFLRGWESLALPQIRIHPGMGRAGDRRWVGPAQHLPGRGVTSSVPGETKGERGEARCSSGRAIKPCQRFPAPLSAQGEVWLHLLRHPPGQGLGGVQLHRLAPPGLALSPVRLGLAALEDGQALREGFGLREQDVVVEDGSCCSPDQGAHPEHLGRREKRGEQNPGWLWRVGRSWEL